MESNRKEIILNYLYDIVYWYRIHYLNNESENYEWMISPEEEINGKDRICLYISFKDKGYKIQMVDVVLKDNIEETLKAIDNGLNDMITKQIESEDIKIKVKQFHRYIKALGLGNIVIHKNSEQQIYQTMDGMEEIFSKINYLVDLANTRAANPYQPLHTLRWKIQQFKQLDDIRIVCFSIYSRNNETGEENYNDVFNVTINVDSTLNEILGEIYDNVRKLDRSYYKTFSYSSDRDKLYDELCTQIKYNMRTEEEDFNPFYLYDFSESQKDAYTELLKITEPKGEQELRFWNLAITKNEENGNKPIIEIYTNKDVTPLEYKMNLSVTDGDTREILDNLFYYLNRYISTFTYNEIVTDFAKKNLNSNLSINEITIEAERLYQEMKALSNLIEKTYQTYVKKENNNGLMEELKEEYNALVKIISDGNVDITRPNNQPKQLAKRILKEILQDYINEL